MEQKSIDEIKAREQAATPGPWEWRATADNEAVGMIAPGEVIMCGEIEHFRIDRKNAEFIAHSRTYIPELVAEVERLQSVEKSAKRLDEENRKLIIERDDLKDENATLKRALKGVFRFYGVPDEVVISLVKELEAKSNTSSLEVREG